MKPEYDPIPLPFSPSAPALVQASFELRQHHTVLPLIGETAGADELRVWRADASGGSVQVRLQWTVQEDGGRLCLAMTSGTGDTLPVDWSLEFLLAPSAWEVRYPAANGVVERKALPNMRPPDAPGGTGFNPAFVYRVGAATGQAGLSIAVPVLRVETFAGREDDSTGLTVAVDPMDGVVFSFGGTVPAVGYGEGGSFDGVTRLTVSGSADFDGGATSREILLRWDSGDFAASLETLAETVPDIARGPEWLSGIGIIHYDYNSRGGRGWYEHLQFLADRLDEAERGRVCAVIHGWYDYLGSYTFKDGKLLREWTAFPGTRKIPMSIEEIHRRAAFARRLGMRVLLYFADGLLCDSGTGFFRRGLLACGPDNEPLTGWEGPDTLGRTCAMDPAHPEVRAFFFSYLDRLLEEYRSAVDGFVWDETFYVRAGYRGHEGKWSDRAMLSLVRELTRRVQAAGEDLAFLTSDATGTYPENSPPPPTALLSHGTYQDSWNNPAAWAGGAFANARKVLWSCNWHPVTNHSWNLYATRVLGYPMSFTDGWGDECGPAGMPAKLFDECLAAFRTMPSSRKYAEAVPVSE